jgi:hypothetical protein
VAGFACPSSSPRTAGRCPRADGTERTECRSACQSSATWELRRRGKRVSGKPPFGYRFDGSDVVEEHYEQQLLARILEFRGMGYGARRIASARNDMGAKNPRTRRWWTHGTIGDLLRTATRA